MKFLAMPWLELAIAITLVGSLFVTFLRDPDRAYRWALAFTGTSFACASLAWLAFYLDTPAEMIRETSPQSSLFGRQVLGLDDLSAPLVPAISLLHLLKALATPRTYMRRFSFSWLLAAESIRLATFSCTEPWVLIGLLATSTVPPYVELVNRGRPTRVYVLHMALFVGLLVLGWSAAGRSGDSSVSAPWWASFPLLLAILVRCGTVPAHCWVTDWFEHASFGNALL